MKEIGNADRQEAGRRLNNRAENSHQPLMFSQAMRTTMSLFDRSIALAFSCTPKRRQVVADLLDLPRVELSSASFSVVLLRAGPWPTN